MWGETVRIKQVGDKGVSAGEGANILIKKLFVQEARIGLASKDLSRLEVQEVNIKNALIGLTAFQKKSEYGPGFLQISQPNIESVRETYWLEKNSDLSIDEVVMRPIKKAVHNLLYANGTPE